MRDQEAQNTGGPGGGATYEEPESEVSRRLAAFVLRHKALIVLAALATTVVAAWAIDTQLRLDMTVESFLDTDSPALKNLEEYRDTFGRDDAFLVMVEGDVFSMPFLTKLRALHNEVAALDLPLKSLHQRFRDRRAKEGASAPAAPAAPAASAASAAQGTTSGQGVGTSGDVAPGEAGSKAKNQAGDGFDDAPDFGDSGDFDEGATAGFDDTPDLGEGGDFGEEGAAGAKAGASSGGAGTAGAEGVGEDGDDDWGGESGGTIIDEIISLINVRRTRGRRVPDPDGGTSVSIEVGSWLSPWPTAAQLPALREAMLAEPSLVGQVLDTQGRYTTMLVRPQFMSAADGVRVNDALVAILAKYNGPGFRTYLSGGPALAASITRLFVQEVSRLLVLSLVTLVLMMFFLFRHPLGVVGPVAVVGLAAFWTFGFMALVGMPVTMVSSILPAFLISVGVGDSVHIMSVYRDRRRHGAGNHEAIVHALGTTGRAILFTSLTTAVGLLSFQFATIGAVRDVGLAGAFGVMVALGNTVLLLPIALHFNRRGSLGAARQHENDWIDRVLAWASRLSGRETGAPLTGARAEGVRARSRRVLVVAVGLTALAVYGGSLLRVWHNPVSWVPDDVPAKIAFNELDAHAGGTATIQLLIRAKGPHGVKDLELLRGLEKLEGYIRAYRHADVRTGEVRPVVGGSVSLLDVARETNRALHGGDPAFYRLPDSQRALADTLFLFENAAPQDLRRLATADLKQTQMTIRVRWLEATAYGPLTRYVDKGIAKYIGDRAEVRTTGAAFTLFTTVSSLIDNLIRSFAVAFGVITVLMILLLGDLRLGLVAMVPNLLPIVFIMGIMGFADVPLDMANLMIASIAIGLAVDDTIHFLHHFHLHYVINGQVEAAIDYAYRHTGRALVGTTAILGLGFVVYVASQLLSLQRFGVLIGLTVVLALLVDLIFGPAMLRMVYRDRPAAGSPSAAPAPAAAAENTP